jgi:hypothetical protein
MSELTLQDTLDQEYYGSEFQVFKTRNAYLKHAYRSYCCCLEGFNHYPTRFMWSILFLWMQTLKAAAPQFEPPTEVMAVAILHRYI